MDTQILNPSFYADALPHPRPNTSTPDRPYTRDLEILTAARFKSKRPKSLSTRSVRLHYITESFRTGPVHQSADTIIIPFSQVDVSLTKANGTPTSISANSGQFIVAPADTLDGVAIAAPCEVAVIVADRSIRSAIERESETSSISRLNQSILIQRATQMKAIAQLVRRLVLGTPVSARIAANSVATLAVSEALISISNQVEPTQPKTKGLSDGVLEQLDAFINHNIDQDISLSDLAEQSGLTSYHFSRTFKSVTGVSPYQYVLNKRIANARRLLERGGEPLADVAYACGFSSQSHMTEIFRRRLGITPGRYRREHSAR